MQLDDKDLEEFIRIYEEDFGEKVSLNEARAIAHNLLLLSEKLMEPLPDEKKI